jgi:hypothetical protein
MAFAAVVQVIVSGCGGDVPADKTEATTVQPLFVPRFDRDSAFHYVERQLSFGPRVPNTSAHRRCKDWLAESFRSMGCEVTEQPFQARTYTGKTVDGVNIMARFQPEAPRRILLAAHWDSRFMADSPLNVENSDSPIPGADDGGSGVAVLLELARQLQAHPVDIGVDFLLFDAEDQGSDSSVRPDPTSWCLGSQYWSRNIIPGGYRPMYGILLDMVGAKGARFLREEVSMTYAPQVMNKVWKLAQGLGYGAYFVNETSGAVTDDHYFVNTIARIPMIDIIGKSSATPTGFGAHWHTQTDDLSVIDTRTLRAVGQTLLELIYREAAGRF